MILIDIPILFKPETEEAIDYDSLGIKPSFTYEDCIEKVVTINASYIQYLEPTTNGCVVQLIDDDFVATVTPKEIADAIQSALSDYRKNA